ncbi:MAG: serine--tRNA ligase, partial [Clostridia bacterium]|nr:serine--tRNA ligase [Clostridia bacterium]
MLDLNRIRNNQQEVVELLKRKGHDVDFNEVIAWDDERKALITEIEQLKAKRNKVSAEIPKLKKEGKPVEPIFKEMREIGDQIAEGDEKINGLIEKINSFLCAIPNIPDSDLLAGEKENNQVVKVWREKPTFDFKAKSHYDLCVDLGLIDYERGVKLS